MQIVAILIGVIMTAGVGWYVSRPLLQARRMPTTDAPVQSMEVQRDSLYAQIGELDLDHATGKTNDEDYQQVRAGLVTQAADMLRLIDGQAPTVSDKDADIEALIAARRKQKPAARADLDQQLIDGQKPAAKTQDADVETLIAARRKTTAKPTGKADLDQQLEDAIKARRSTIVCPKCGKPATAGDVFCSRCGTSLPQPQRV